jgi:hypothetical protein
MSTRTSKHTDYFYLLNEILVMSFIDSDNNLDRLCWEPKFDSNNGTDVSLLPFKGKQSNTFDYPKHQWFKSVLFASNSTIYWVSIRSPPYWLLNTPGTNQFPNSHQIVILISAGTPEGTLHLLYIQLDSEYTNQYQFGICIELRSGSQMTDIPQFHVLLSVFSRDSFTPHI